MKIEKLDKVIEQINSLRLCKPRHTFPIDLVLSENADMTDYYYRISPKFINEDHWYVDPPIASELQAAHGLNIVGHTIKSPFDLATLYKAYRSDTQEVFRIIYIRNNEIAGYDNLTSKHTGDSQYMVYDKNLKGQDYTDDNFLKLAIKSFMIYNTKYRRLNADGYYLFHNHPSESTEPSPDDINVTQLFIDNLDGKFLGHIIMSPTKYRILYDGNGTQSIEYTIDDKYNLSKRIHGNFKLIDDLVHRADKLINEDDFSIVFYTTGKKVTDSILVTEAIDNYEFRDVNFYRYIVNNANKIGSLGTYLITTSRKVFWSVPVLCNTSMGITEVVLVEDNEFFLKSDWRNSKTDIDNDNTPIQKVPKVFKIH